MNKTLKNIHIRIQRKKFYLDFQINHQLDTYLARKHNEKEEKIVFEFILILKEIFFGLVEEYEISFLFRRGG